MEIANDLKENYQAISSQVRGYEATHLAKEHHIKVVAVSKMQSIQKIKQMFKLGQRDFGENYVQEALKKQKIFSLDDSYNDLCWHFIGHLQTNKLKDVAGKFEIIHSVDSLKLATKMNSYLQVNSPMMTQKILLQINLSQEKTKSGFDEQNVLENLPTLLKMKNIKICGLMSLPPLQNDPTMNRVYFQQLRALQEKLNEKILDPQKRLVELSMGTSHDFHIALEEGATLVRVGTLLFGSR